MENYLTTLKMGIFDWVSNELKVTTIHAEQFRVRPEKFPYAVIRLSSVLPYGNKDESDPVDDEGIAKVNGHRRATASIDILGTNANELALQLQASLSKVTVTSKLWDTYGIAVLGHGEIQNVTELLETSGLERAVFDIKIGFAVQYEDIQGLIEHVELTAKYKGEVISEETIPPLA